MLNQAALHIYRPEGKSSFQRSVNEFTLQAHQSGEETSIQLALFPYN